MAVRKVLFVLTGHSRLGSADDSSTERTGFHLYEAARPWSILNDAGIEVDLVTPAGGDAPIDPSSKDLNNADSARFLGDQRVVTQLENSRALTEIELDDYHAIYFPGGHGTMWDLPVDRAVATAVRTMYETGKVVAAVCHGPAALVNVKGSDGRWLVDGKTISAFTDEEERLTGKHTIMPFALSSLLEERGASLNVAEDFEPAVSVDGHLVTGQNPASADGVGEAIRDLVLRGAAPES